MTLFTAAVLIFIAVVQGGDPGHKWLILSQKNDYSDEERAAYAQIARLHLCEFQEEDHRGSFSIVSFDRNSNSPTDILARMGVNILPVLAEALDDVTPTKTITHERGSSRDVRVWQVRELAARLIRHIAGRDFVIGNEVNALQIADIKMAEPWTVAELQKKVIAWHAANRAKTPAERKIGDVADDWFRNRFDAMQWLGENKVADGAAPIRRRIDEMLDNQRLQESSLVFAELGESAQALGRIGDKASLPHVRRVFDFLSAETYRWDSEFNFNHWTMVHAAMQLLGAGDEAAAKVRSMLDKRSERVNPEIRRRLTAQLPPPAQK